MVMTIEEHEAYLKKKKKNNRIRMASDIGFVPVSTKNETSKISVPTQTTKSLSDLKTDLKKAELNKNVASSLLKSSIKNSGIEVDNNSLLGRPNAFTERTQIFKDNQSGKKSILDYSPEDIKMLETKDLRNVSKYNQYVSHHKSKVEKVLQARDNESIARSNYQQKKAEEDYNNSSNIGKLWQKTGGALIRGMGSTLSPLADGNVVRNEKGETYKLPGYNDAMQSITRNDSGFIGKMANDVLYQSGKILTSQAINKFIPGAGSTLYFTNLYEDQIDNAMNEGYNGKQAIMYASIGTATELVTGKLLGSAVGLFSSKGSTESFISNLLKPVIKNQKVNNILSSMGSEATEEFVQEYLDGLNRNISLNEKNDVFSVETFKNATYSALIGGLSSALPSSVQEFGANEISSKANQIVYDIERANNTELSNTNKALIENILYEQIFEGRQNINSKDIVDAYQQIKNEKINNFINSANQYLVEGKVTTDFVNNVNKIIYDNNYNVVFDDKLTDDSGKMVNGKISTLNNGEIEIRLNPNSSKAGEFLIVHEVTHAIETEEMKNLILEYARKHDDYKTAVKDLENTYKSSDVSSEVIADISGQVLGSQEFINNLSLEKPSIFKQIYNSIISLANKVTGNSNEALFVKDLKNKWETAYRNTTNEQSVNNLNNNAKYHISKNFSNEIDEVLTGKYKSNNQVKARDFTPEILVKNGVKDLPMLMTSKHVKSTILTELEAKNSNMYEKNVNYHGLGKETLINVIDSLDNPTEIYKTSQNEFLIITEILDKQGNNIVVPIRIDGKGTYNDVYIEENQIKSAYGRKNITKYIQNNNFKKIYTKKGTTLNERVQYSNISNSNTENISQFNNNVKLPTKYSMQNDVNNTQNNENNIKWQDYLDKNYKSTGTKTNLSDIKIPSVDTKQTNKVLNPNEISKLTIEDANTTPKLPKVNRNKAGDGKSKFASNIENKVNMLNNEQKYNILESDEVKYYDKVTNKESLDKAFERLNKDGLNESIRWFNKESTEANSVDVAEGYILLKQYADNGDYDSMVETAKKLRDIGTKAGQTVQAFNIMERMTPEGMVKYAQSELQEAYDKMIKNKSQEWIDKHRSDFDLKPDEVQFIMDTMKDVSTMEDGYDKRVKLAEIQKIMTDKLPPEKGSGIKSWMRISMLFNPKTQVRNVAGNAIIMPVNSFGDLFANYADKIISKKTGVRTTGKTNIKAMLKGMKEGAYQATNDYKKGINTKDMEGNRFEITEGKNFNDKALMGKSLNRIEGMLNYVMDVGDRVFSQAAFENSLQNQLILNNTTEITQDMLDIARTESLQRTWNDNNNYTKFVLDVRRMMNKLHVPGANSYGLGDILIPFAKTPANLTKAIVDYSPAGLVKTIIEGNNLKKSLSNGQYTPQMQHKFVQDLGKATAGTMLYVLGYALAKSEVISGDSDDDKDVSNFLKNTLGINSYSIKIGNKSFTYDWAQPLAAPLSIAANVVNSKNNKGQAFAEAILSSLDTAGSILLEQSFLQSINDVLSDNEGVVSGLINEVLELPARAVPTFSKQIADIVDGTQRTSFAYGKPIESAINSIKVKVPFVSKTLAPTVDTLGREVKKYGGKNNIFNVFLNPANVNTENVSDSAKEIYRLYKKTGEKNIMPRVAPYYFAKDGEKTIFDSKQREKYQKISGEIIEESVSKLLDSKEYKNMSDKTKADVVNNLVDYAYNIAQKEVVGKELSDEYKTAYEYSKIGDIQDYYLFKNSIDNDNKKESISNFLINSDLEDKQLAFLYGKYYSSETKLESLVKMKIPIKEFIKVNSEDITSDYNSKTGQTITNSKKKKYMQYVNSLNLTVPQKAILIKMQYNSFDSYNNNIVNYINNLNMSIDEKKVLLKTTGFDNFDKDVIQYINSQRLTVEEKEKKLKSLGFTIRDGRVYY